MGTRKALSPQARDAARVLGLEIARARRAQRRTAADVAERAGITRATLRKIERGDPTVAIGTFFEVATLLGVALFGAEREELARLVARGQDRVALLPARVRQPPATIDDDF